MPFRPRGTPGLFCFLSQFTAPGFEKARSLTYRNVHATHARYVPFALGLLSAQRTRGRSSASFDVIRCTRVACEIISAGSAHESVGQLTFAPHLSQSFLTNDGAGFSWYSSFKIRNVRQ